MINVKAQDSSSELVNGGADQPVHNSSQIDSSYSVGSESFSKDSVKDTFNGLEKLMEDAHSGSYAVGALGQKLLDQQNQIKSLLERLEKYKSVDSHDGDKDETRSLIEHAQEQIKNIKKEQQLLVKDFLHASNIQVASSTPASSEAQALLSSLGMQASPAESSNQSSKTRELRRQKNAAAPNLSKDEVLINEIQGQLISELRRMQALVADRDRALAAMSESLEESSRIKALHEASIKKLETQKDSQDASLYELEAKEAILREEHEEIVKQLKKHENELRTLKRQLAEKTDLAESLKASNEEYEEKTDELRSTVTTLKAKAIADQKAISGLKTQVNDFEVKHRQALEKIPASGSGWSQSHSAEESSDLTQTALRGSHGTDSPSVQRTGAHNQALTPTTSVDEGLASRLRPNDKIKSMETDIAKWRAAAFKYRKKWNDTRRHASSDAQGGEHDDSTDEDESIWMDDVSNLHTHPSIKSRIVSSASRRNKTMGDAFGLHQGGRRSSWHSHEGPEGENSFNDDDASSTGASSTHGSIDGYDPTFADPTIRATSSQNKKRRSALPFSNAGKASPLTRELDLSADDRSDGGESFASLGRQSSIAHATGALGDELFAAQEQPNAPIYDEDRIASSVDAAVAERDAGHAIQIDALQKEHANALSHHSNLHSQALEMLQRKHSESLASRDADHESLIAQLEQDHLQKMQDSIAKHSQIHEQAMTDARERHAQALSVQREEAQANLIAAQRQHKRLLDERVKLHEDALHQKDSEHGRALLHKQREFERESENIRAAHETQLQQYETTYKQHIASQDQVIQGKEHEIMRAHARIADLEHELAKLREEMQSTSDSLDTANKALKDSQDKSMSGSLSQRSIEEYLDAEESRPEVVKTEETNVFGDRSVDSGLATAKSAHSVHLRESASQTDEESGAYRQGVSVPPLPTDASSSFENDARKNVDGTWLAKSSMISRSDNPISSSDVIKAVEYDGESSVGAEESQTAVLTIPPPPQMPPPTASFNKETNESTANSGAISPSAEPKDRSAKLQPSLGETNRPTSRLSSGPPPSSYMPPPSILPRKSQTPSLRSRTKSTESTVARREVDRQSMSSRLARHPMRAPSAQSFASDATSEFVSGRSSRASNYVDNRSRMGPGASFGPVQSNTDPAVLGSITQTMIGAYLYKYTRRSMGRGGKRHRRYFWVHPYTRTLYWTMTAPSEAVSSEQINKSAFIQDIMVVDDDNNSPSGLYHMSIVVQSLSRELKITASNREQHELWVTALGYLVNRELSSATTKNEPSEWRQTINRASGGRPSSRLSGRTSYGTMNTPARPPNVARKSFASLASTSKDQGDSERTPRARGASTGNYPSLLHRKDTAAREYLEQWELLQNGNSETTPRAGSSMTHRSKRGTLAKEMFGEGISKSHPRDPRSMSAEEMLEEDAKNTGYEGLDNVRACCNGKHDVSTLAHRHSHSRPSSTRAKSSMSGTARQHSRQSSHRGATDSEDEGRRPSSSLSNGTSQLGPLSVNNLESGRTPARHGGMTESGTAKALSQSEPAVQQTTIGEFGDVQGRTTPALGEAESREIPSSATTSKRGLLDTLTQIRRNRQSASIR